MDRRLSLDTGVLIGLERRTLPRSVLAEDDDLVMSIAVVAEYMVGIELASSAYRPRMERFLDSFLENTPVLAFDEEVLLEYVKLMAWTRRHGCPRGQFDLIIAATAIATGRELLTLDRRARFEELPGLRVRVLDPAR